MTKLTEWIVLGIVTSVIWVAFLANKADSELQWYHRWFPVIVVFLFGLYAATVVLYRTFTFNNCETAAIELQKVSLKLDLKVFIKFTLIH